MYGFSKKHQEEAKAILMEYFNKLKESNPNLEIKGYYPYYFLFNQDVLHFRSTKLNDEKHGWLFGIWACYDDDGNINGVTYFGEADEFLNKFKPSYTNVSTDDEKEFLAKLESLEKNPKQGFIEEYFAGKDDDGVADYKEYFAKKEHEKELKKECLQLLTTKIPQLVKESGLGLRGVAIVDQDWHTGWHSSPRFHLSGWENCKQAKTSDNDQYWQDFEDKIIKPYNESLKDIVSDEDWSLRMEFELPEFRNRMWTQQDAMCSCGRYITFFESPIKKPAHRRNRMIEKASAYRLS